MKGRRRGFLIPIAILLVFVMIILAFSMQSTSFQQLRLASQRVRQEQVQAAADGGLVVAIQHLASNPSYPGQVSKTLVGNGPQAYTVRVLKAPDKAPTGQAIPEGCAFLWATGHLENHPQRHAGAMVRLGTATTRGLPGIFATKLTLRNGSSVDSYDSRLETSKISRSGKGLIVTNSTQAGSIQILGGSRVNASIQVGPKGLLEPNPQKNTSTLGQAYTIWRDWGNTYNSASLQEQPLELPSVEFPSKPGEQEVSIKKKGSILAPGNYDAVEISGGASVTLASGTYVMSKLQVSGAAQVNLAEGARVKLYILEEAEINNGADLSNPCLDPIQLQLFLAEGATYEQSGSAKLTGIVYGPEAQIKLNNAATVYGSVVGKLVEMSGSSDVFWDEALSNFEQGGGKATGNLQILFRQRW